DEGGEKEKQTASEQVKEENAAREKEDFQEAVRSISELTKLKNGNTWEQKEFNRQVDNYKDNYGNRKDLPEEIKWGSTQQSENNQDQGNKDKGSGGNGKKGKNNDNNNDSQEPKRAKIEEEVKQDQAKKDEEATNTLTNDLAGLASKSDQEKEQSLVDIEKLKNQGGVYGQRKEEIKEKKDELAKKDPQGYGKIIAKVIQQKMKEFKVEINKLGSEIKEKIKKLQNGEITNDEQVREIEEEVSEKVSEEVANVETNDLLAQAQNLLKGTAGNLKSQLEKIKKGLYSLKLSINPYQQKAYQLQKPRIEKALKDLESLSQNNTHQPNKSGFFQPKVIISLGLLAVLALVV
ncbi:673_t:CDS:2, partial [Ambispora leptoticha]